MTVSASAPAREVEAGPARTQAWGPGTGKTPFRQIRRAGKGEVVISLPRGWVKGSGLRPGDALRLQSAGPGRLLLEDARFDGQAWQSPLRCRGPEPPAHLFRSLVACYLTGAPEIVLSFSGPPSPVLQRTVRDFARRTGRMEVVAEEAGTLVLRDISGGADAEPLDLVLRMARAVLDLQRRAATALESLPTTEEVDWEGQDDLIDRLEWRVHRSLSAIDLSRLGSGDPSHAMSESLHLLATARALERIADHALRIGQAATSFPRPHPLPPRARTILELHRRALGLLERTIPLVQEPNAEEANSIVDMVEAQHAGHLAVLQSLLSPRAQSPLAPLTAAWLAIVLDSVDRTAAYVSDIAELVLDRAAVHGIRARELGTSPSPSPSPSRFSSEPLPAAGVHRRGDGR
jgi:phosphate uptake regulator